MFVGCRSQQGDYSPRSRGGNKGKSLEIENLLDCALLQTKRAGGGIGHAHFYFTTASLSF